MARKRLNFGRSIVSTKKELIWCSTLVKLTLSAWSTHCKFSPTVRLARVRCPSLSLCSCQTGCHRACTLRHPTKEQSWTFSTTYERRWLQCTRRTGRTMRDSFQHSPGGWMYTSAGLSIRWSIQNKEWRLSAQTSAAAVAVTLQTHRPRSLSTSNSTLQARWQRSRSIATTLGALKISSLSNSSWKGDSGVRILAPTNGQLLKMMISKAKKLKASQSIPPKPWLSRCESQLKKAMSKGCSIRCQQASTQC